MKRKEYTSGQVIKEITSEHKWYIGVLSQSMGWRFMNSWKKGKLKPSTVAKVIKNYGWRKLPDRYVKIEEDE